MGELADDRSGWPEDGKLLLGGFTYSRLADTAPRTVDDRLDWLSRQPGYSPQPYEQLIRVYRSGGHDQEARDLAIARQRARQLDGGLSRLSKAWNWFLDVTIGHGYKPRRVAALLPLLYLPTWRSGGAPNTTAGFPPSSPDKMVVTGASCTSHYPRLSRWVYPVDYPIPIINLHQADTRKLDANTGWGHAARNWTYLATGLGWPPRPSSSAPSPAS